MKRIYDIIKKTGHKEDISAIISQRTNLSVAQASARHRTQSYNAGIAPKIIIFIIPPCVYPVKSTCDDTPGKVHELHRRVLEHAGCNVNEYTLRL